MRTYQNGRWWILIKIFPTKQEAINLQVEDQRLGGKRPITRVDKIFSPGRHGLFGWALWQHYRDGEIYADTHDTPLEVIRDWLEARS